MPKHPEKKHPALNFVEICAKFDLQWKQQNIEPTEQTRFNHYDFEDAEAIFG